MAKDPYRYFRIEAQELVESLRQDVLGLEKSPASRELLAKVLRLAHTLKGAARVVRQSAIADLAHSIEDVLAPLRDAQQPVSREVIVRVLGFLDGITVQVAELSRTAANPAAAAAQGQNAGPATAPPASSADITLETVRVDIQEVDQFLEQVALLRAQIAQVKRSLAGLGGVEDALRLGLRQARPRSVGNESRIEPVLDESLSRLAQVREAAKVELEKLERVAAYSRESATQLRLLPASVIFPSLEYAVRDAANVLERTATFSASGGDIRLDAHVLTGLRDALIHVVRNAVAHGIEPANERLQKGKPDAGRIELKLERRGGRVALVCSDDGRGIDVEALKKAAQERGQLSADKAASLSVQELTPLMLQGGISTARSVTAIAGRGVGMDVVRDTAHRLKGEVSIQSKAGAGTRVEFCVPYSLSSLKVLVMRDGPARAAIPLDCIRRTQRLPSTGILRSAQGESIAHEDGALPFMPLSRLLGQSSARENVPIWTVLEIQSSAGRAALGVEHLSSALDWVVYPLPRHIQAHPILAGASLDAEGAPVVVLSAPETVQTLTMNGDLPVQVPKAASPTVLVVDDSLTTRMLEQSILESAGYTVDLATSAEEGLVKARANSYALFLVDVEMPGMDGFQFVSAIRADSGLSRIPAILVTSRNAPEDKERGRNAGASDYMVKSEFDQGRLLSRIRELIGA